MVVAMVTVGHEKCEEIGLVMVRMAVGVVRWGR